LINVHRRWLLPAIFGGVLLLLASTGLFLMLHPTTPAAATRPLGPAIVGAPGAVAWGPNRLDISP
jgi:hypothetical protein